LALPFRFRQAASLRLAYFEQAELKTESDTDLDGTDCRRLELDQRREPDDGAKSFQTEPRQSAQGSAQATLR